MPNYFLQTIRHLRTSEEVMLWANLLAIAAGDEAEVGAYLVNEYTEESLDYPHTPPGFDADAALWGAKTVYVAAQLVAYRQHQPDELPVLLPPFPGTITAAAMHSADLTLRFLSDIIQFLTHIDSGDPLIPVLEQHLLKWHFSGIAYWAYPDNPDLSALDSDACLRQRYVDRLIAYNRKPSPALTTLWESINISLGDQKTQLYLND